jgi:hypothetical protein
VVVCTKCGKWSSLAVSSAKCERLLAQSGRAEQERWLTARVFDAVIE